MYVIEKMRLNRFELRPCVSARALFAAKGAQAATVSSKCDSSCYDSPNIDGASKTKLLGLVDEMAQAAYAKRESNGNSPDMPKVNAVNK